MEPGISSESPEYIRQIKSCLWLLSLALGLIVLGLFLLAISLQR